MNTEEIDAALRYAGIVPEDTIEVVSTITERMNFYVKQMERSFMRGDSPNVLHCTSKLKHLADAMEVYNKYMGVFNQV